MENRLFFIFTNKEKNVWEKPILFLVYIAVYSVLKVSQFFFDTEFNNSINNIGIIGVLLRKAKPN